MHGVMPGRKLGADCLHFHRDQTQAAALEAAEDLADQPALHAVGLDDNQ